MPSIQEALSLVLTRTSMLPPQQQPVLESVGCVLAEDVHSDIDSPPHDKSMVDGYAIALAGLTPGLGAKGEFAVLEEVTAGALPTQKLTPGSATRIMTGAPIPPGAEAVVMIEKAQLKHQGDGGERVLLEFGDVRHGANILRRAASLSKGQLVVQSGQTIRPLDVGVLSEVGRTTVSVHRTPQVAIMTTGNELVTPDVAPGPGMIRNSNSPMLVAMCRAAGAAAEDLGIARDEEEAIAARVAEGLKRDVLILSGGVSAGVLDLVPKVLAAAGVTQVFHKVELKPGKPLWFGTRTVEDKTTLVFGLPGNPVGALVCFELFIRPALARLKGHTLARPPVRARLTKDHAQRGDRPTYFPAKLTLTAMNDLLPEVETLDWRGSADLATLAKANCLAYFPPGDKLFAADEVIDCLLLE